MLRNLLKELRRQARRKNVHVTVKCFKGPFHGKKIRMSLHGDSYTAVFCVGGYVGRYYVTHGVLDWRQALWEDRDSIGG